MQARDLDLRELLDFDPGGGLITFAGERTLLLDAQAMGLLRRELIEAVGATAARCILTRFGYAHGWRAAQSLETDFPWDSSTDWAHAGGYLHTLHGLVVVKPLPWSEDDGPEPLAKCRWEHSYEAEQHRLQLGQSEEPVCWSLCGFASGYLSFCTRQEVICVERSCAGRGDGSCELVGRSAEDWGEEAEPHRAFYDPEAIQAALKQTTRALRTAESQLVERRRELARMVEEAEDAGIVARSPAMRATLDLARRLAKVDSTVLITGESGSGKERVARCLHRNSPRKEGPFLAVNCGAIAETLLESELFGHAKGAFTGADRDREGLFEAARGGTLLLDEVGETPPSMQVKLLRVLQEREIRRVGEVRNRSIDVRVLAATHRDLAAEIAAGSFREDLYYRLRVVEIPVPAARQRKEDLLDLARFFLSRAAERLQRRVLGFSPRAADRLLTYSWPGNVRELENAVERAVILCQGTRIEPEDLPAEVRERSPASAIPPGVRPLEDVERDHIRAALESNGGHREKTAAQLGIGTATLYRKLNKYGLA